MTTEQREEYPMGELTADELAASILLANSFVEQGRLQDASIMLEGLVLLDEGNPYLHMLLGSICQRQDHNEEAVAHYTAAIELFPQDITSLANRGEIFLRMGKLKDSAEDLKAAIDLDPDGQHPCGNRARLLATLVYEALQEKGVEALQETKKQ